MNYLLDIVSVMASIVSVEGVTHYFVSCSSSQPAADIYSEREASNPREGYASLSKQIQLNQQIYRSSVGKTKIFC